MQQNTTPQCVQAERLRVIQKQETEDITRTAWLVPARPRRLGPVATTRLKQQTDGVKLFWLRHSAAVTFLSSFPLMGRVLRGSLRRTLTSLASDQNQVKLNSSEDEGGT